MTTGRRVAWLLLAASAVGCKNEDEVLAKLAGGWSGTIQSTNGPLALTGSCDFEKDSGLLTGTFTIADPGTPHAYAVRRWTVTKDTVYLDLTDAVDPTRGLDLDGTVDGGFSGQGRVAWTCPEGTCGYEGDFSLQRAEGIGSVPSTPSDTAASTPSTPSTPSDTAASTPSDTAAR